jgi:hypothetical protein
MKKKKFETKLTFEKATILELNQLTMINGGNKDGGGVTPEVGTYRPAPTD